MQKKLLAVAVAGALGVPAAAMAASTVQVYGRFYVEYGVSVDQGRQSNVVPVAPASNDRNSVDMLQAPGSNIGFKGEEKLGGGLSAWFQCESTADVRGSTDGTAGFCSRNSAVGLKGNFGNVYIGTWDTPFKRATNNVGANDTGLFGTSWLLFGGSTTVSESSSNGAVALNRAVFKRRQRNSINYYSPKFSGFQVGVSYSATNGATAVTTGVVNSKPRVMSLGATYDNGPLGLGAGYQRHNEFAGPVLGASDDTGWHVNGDYKFGKFKVGGIYTEQKFEVAGTVGTGENKVKAWSVGAEWNIQGPHNLMANYTTAGDAKGIAGGLAPAADRMRVAADTGADLWQIRYMYQLSKRTKLSAGYTKLDNDNNANYRLGGPARPATGENQDAFAIAVDHRF
jgi:predicted porin